jgi:Ca2+-binding EF-hand superfamily protein
MKPERKPLGVINLSGILGPAMAGPESLKTISEVIMEQYDKENEGRLSNRQVEQMMRDMYRSMNIDYKPTRAEVDQYAKLLDLEKSQQVDEKNIEKVAKKYLVTPKVEYKKYTQTKYEVTTHRQSVFEKQSSTHTTNASSTGEGSLQEASSVHSQLSKTQELRSTVLSSQSTSVNFAATTTLNSNRSASPAPKTAPNPNDMKTAFSEFDFDKDEKINSFEFQRALMRYGWKFGVNPMKVNLEEHFNRADSDLDGLISYGEFASIIHGIN